MQAARAPSPVRGLAVALLLGVVLAVAAVAVLVNIPPSAELTGAYQGTPLTNQTKANPGNMSGGSLLPVSNATAGAPSSSSLNSTAPSIVSVNDFVAAVSNQQTPGAANSSFSSTTASNYLGFTPVSSQQKSEIVATGWRDLIIFAGAGALALAAFLISRRQMS